MSIDTSKIEIGAGNLSVKAAGEGDYTDCGAALDAELAPKVERKEVECAQVLGTVKAPIVGTAVEFKVQLLERSLRNVALALGGDPADISAEVGPPAYHEFKWGGSFKNTECDIKYEVPQVDDRDKTDTLRIKKALAINGTTLPYKKKNETIFELTFMGIVDTSDGNHLTAIQRED